MKLELKAMAKVNLGLDVIRRREDGYHDVKMVMQTVNLYDNITLESFDCENDNVDKKNQIQVSTNLSFLPNDENNLAYKAAKLLFDEFSVKDGLKIYIEKNIPVAAGMAGGSTDAAAVMQGVNELFKLGLSINELMERSVRIGADVPYCIMGGTALSEGIGEKLTELKPAPKCKILIVKPPISVSTKFVYENLHANELKYHPDIDGMVEAINNNDLYGVSSRMENVLETVTVKEYPIIDEIKKYMKDNGAINALMSGSGPTVFGLFDDNEKAEEAYRSIKEKGFSNQVFLTDLFNRGN